jgi:Lrp/AsnC family leucine-responsive transcriptional regulator
MNYEIKIYWEVFVLDQIDFDIIRELQANGRIPMKLLADRVGLTPPAVGDRVKRLEQQGIITGYRAIISPSKIGKTLLAFINVSMRANKHKDFYEIVNSNKNVLECHHVTGNYCMIIKACFREISELESFINKIQQIGDTNTSIVLSTNMEYNALV